MSSTLPFERPLIDKSNSSGFDLVEMLLQEQRSMTAVERFSALHDAGPQPAQSRYYRDLMPATPPNPGQQFAFSVDLDTCSGCKACVVACHTMNGLEDDESWRSVGTITLGDGPQSRVQHVTAACHHCEDPGCLNGCPVQAYDKDPVTGIVRHLDDQCIGCKYCMMMCPYEVPRYNHRLGIVRKCDMCHQRLSVGEAPACVQACPNQAIAIRLIETTGREPVAFDRLAPGAPLSTITRPSTTYNTRHTDLLPLAVAQDAGVDAVAESHWPLAAMLVGTQVSVGMLCVERFAASASWLVGAEIPIEVTRLNTLFALVIGVMGLNIAPLHLGQPLRAWRIFLGLRTSWLSREAVVLGMYVGALAAAVAFHWLPLGSEHVPDFIMDWIPDWAALVTLVVAAMLGVAGVFCSAMIYIATQRTLWRHQRTVARFLGTTLAGGLACCGCVLMFSDAATAITALVLLAAIGGLTWKLVWEWRTHLGPSHEHDDSYDHRSRSLISKRLPLLKSLRISTGIAAIVLFTSGLFAALLAWPVIAGTSLVGAAVLLIAGESCERLLYFRSVVYDRMPGTLR